MENNYKQFVDDAKHYAKMRYDFLRLELLDKMSRIISLLLLVIVALVLGLGALIYFSFALAYLLRPLFGSLVIPFSLIGLGYVALLLILYFLRTKIILNPLVKKLSAILFSDMAEPQDDEADTTNPINE